MKRDLLNAERTGQQLTRIVILSNEVGLLWLEAVEHGSASGRSDVGGRGTGFHDLNPTLSAVMSPTQRQLRSKARRAAVLVEQAMQRMEEAEATLKDGFLLTDEEVLTRFLEKRKAALG